MRIAIVSTPYVPVPPVKYGGTEQVVHYLVKGLQELGHEPILLAPGDSQANCKLIPICDKAVNFGKTPAEQSEAQIKINAALDKTKLELENLKPHVDLIHSHGFDLKDMQDFPNLTTLHGKIDFLNFDFFKERKDLFYVSISKNQQETFPDLQYVGVAYNGLDPEMFPIVSEPEDYLCFLGRFDDEKNPHLAIQLALQLNMKIKLGGKVDFAGYEYFERKIKPYLDHPLVEFLGELDFSQKVELVSKARCNLHPTGFREPFGLSVLESAYCGTPTLAIARGSMPELIEEGRTGLLVEDFVQGYHIIHDCFTMDREYIAQRSRFLFNYKTMAKQYVLAYEKVMEIYEKKRLDRDVFEVLKEAKDQISKLWDSKGHLNSKQVHHSI